MSNSVLACLSSSEPVMKKCVKLNNECLMPIVGFGTFRIRGYELIYSVLDCALRAGYRLIDTATVYGNEGDIGAALEQLLPKYNLQRKDIFITSKLAPIDHGDYDIVSKAVKLSLDKLKTSYIDMYLIHWPGVSKENVQNEENLIFRTASWKALSKIYREEKILKGIGVSNYTTTHIKQLLTIPDVVVPAVNQVEFHPYWQQSEEFHEICNSANILLQAYCSIGGSSSHQLINDQVITDVAKESNFSPAQILLRWALQKGYAIIPKSVTASRIEENTKINFAISDEHMKRISNIKYTEKFAWNPDVVR